MKQYLFILLSFLLASCAEQEIGHETPGGIPGEGLRLSVRLGNGTATRALGDPFLSGSEEKRIDRLAFFVHTDEDGLQIYPPVPDDVTDATAAATDYPNNVYLAETAVNSRQYTADVTLTAGGGYMADIVAVANLPKDYDYNQIVTWDGLQDSVTVWADEMPACTPGTGLDDPDRRALIMYGYTREELAKEETNAFTLALERLVARIDITNEAYVPGMTTADPKGGFLLTSVRVLQARPASYITPQPGYTSPDVATISDWQITDIPYGKATALAPDANPTREPDAVDAAAAEADATLQYLWRTLYTYENSDTEHAPTALEIKGAFRGTEVTRRIDFIDADKQPVPLVRNHRYLVRILPAPGQTDITFDIKVSEWDAVDTVQVKPDQTEKPMLTNIVTNAIRYENTEGQTAYDLFYTQDGEMTFDATCSFAPGVRVKYYDDRTGRWTTEGEWLKVEQTAETLEPVTRAVNVYKCSYKVSFPKFDGGLTRKAMLLVHNGASEVECDTLIVRHVITYPGTDLEVVPVTNKSTGTTAIWAPVNVGATKLPEHIYPIKYSGSPFITLTEEQVQSNFEQQGYLFQWGRKTPFRLPLDGSEVLDYMAFANADDYLDYEEAVKPGYADDKFIKLNSSLSQSWFKIQTDSPAPLSIQAAGNTWPRQNDPCPAGWHIPTKDDFNNLIAVIGGEKCDDPSTFLIWKSKSIPGFIISKDPTIAALGGRISTTFNIYWASEYTSYLTGGSFHYSPDGNSKYFEWDMQTDGYSVRCIQE